MSVALAPAPKAESQSIKENLPTSAPRDHAQNTSARSISTSRWAALIAMGTFATSLGNPLVLANLPMKSILVNLLHVSKFEMALFFAFSGIAWILKPVIGVSVDWLSRRFNRATTLAMSAAAAVALWGLIAALPIQYAMLLAGFLLVNIAIVVASNIMGGLVVEQGKEGRSTGRLGSASMAGRHLGYSIAGPLGGYLAGSSLGPTAAIGGAVIGLLIPVAYMLGKDRPKEKVSSGVFGRDVRAAFSQKSFWAAAALVFLFDIAPGFETPLYYYQTQDLKFSNEWLGWLQLISAAGGIVGAVFFSMICSRYSLKVTLRAGVIISALSALLFYFYRDPISAVVVSFVSGIAITLAFLPVLDLAARATPGGIACAGFAVLMSARNLSTHLSDIWGSWLVDAKLGISFTNLIWVNSLTTALVLFAIPILPAYLLAPKDGDVSQLS